MKKTILLLLWSIVAVAQNPNSSSFIDVSYVKAGSSEYENFERGTMKELNQNLIDNRHKVAWYFYKVKYPSGSSTPYNYVIIDVYKDWTQIDFNFEEQIRTALPNSDAKTIIRQLESSRNVVSNQLMQLMGQAVEIEKEPSKFIQVNEMKVKPGETSSYVNLELTYFKPFHTARAEFGIMNNWGLYKYFMPYGEKYTSDYVTFNGYSKWSDIMIQNPPNPWKSIHGDVDFWKIHDETVGKRATTNNELWELLDYTIGAEK